MNTNIENNAIAFHNAQLFISTILLSKPEYRKKKDSLILLLQAMYLYIVDKGYDINDERAIYDIFNGCNLTVLKHKFGSLPKDSPAITIFYYYRSGLPDNCVNDDIVVLNELLKFYFENNIDMKL